MPNYNKVILMGNLTRNPELKYTPSGKAVVDIGLAINDDYTSKSGEKIENTVFVDIVAWDKLAELVAQYLTKGSSILVDGSLQFEQWEDKSGNKRSKHKIRADKIQFLGGKQQTEQTQKPAAHPTGIGEHPNVPDDYNDYGSDIPF